MCAYTGGAYRPRFMRTLSTRLTLFAIAAAFVTACATGPRVPPEQLDHSEITGTARLYESDTADCFELEGRFGGATDTVIEAHFIINPDGRTRDITIVPEAAGRGALGACVARSLATWQFPTFVGAPMAVIIPLYAARQRGL